MSDVRFSLDTLASGAHIGGVQNNAIGPKPCPQNHPDAEVIRPYDPDCTGQSWAVECATCGYTGPEQRTRQEAIDAWNTRPVENALAGWLAYALGRFGHEDCCPNRIDDCNCWHKEAFTALSKAGL